MTKLNLDYSKVLGFLDKSEIDAMQPYVTVAHDAIHEKTGLGNDFLGWVNWPVEYDKDEFEERRVKNMRMISSNKQNLNRIILAKSNNDQRGKRLMFFTRFNV